MKCWTKKTLVLALGAAVLLSVQPPETIRANARLLKNAVVQMAGSMPSQTRSASLETGPEAQAAVLMDVSSGDLLYTLNADTPLPPASMSKMMTEYLVLESIAAGDLKWEEKIKVSPYAAGVIGSKASLTAGDSVTVRDLLAAVSIQSANDAAVVLAERIAGSEEKFAARMNRKAEQFGLSKYSRFINATGLPRRDMGTNAPASIKGEQTLTAGDTAKLAARLLKDHPEILDFSDQPSYRMQYKGKVLVSTNLMLQHEYRNTLYVRGMDGLKTGYTDEAGYCFTGTAVMNGKRYISVVMGTTSSVKRFEETKKLLAYGASGGEGASHELSFGL
jgi:serine-type D-Ala-D-Ala carboxypeptidase (penicillin-binding protein 5/6)